MKKIIIYGGSFNPPTKAHLKLGVEALKSINADEIYFLPVGDLYSKNGLEKAIHRVSMLHILTKKTFKYYPNDIFTIGVDLTEVNSEKKLNTIDTLRIMKEQHKDKCEIYFLLGADNLLYLHEWHNADEILSEYKILAVKRDGYSIEKIIEENALLNKYKQNIVEVNLPNELNISSTKVRELIQANNNVDNYIDIDVKKYILENNLYRSEQ